MLRDSDTPFANIDATQQKLWEHFENKSVDAQLKQDKLIELRKNIAKMLQDALEVAAVPSFLKRLVTKAADQKGQFEQAKWDTPTQEYYQQLMEKISNLNNAEAIRALANELAENPIPAVLQPAAIKIQGELIKVFKELLRPAGKETQEHVRKIEEAVNDCITQQLKKEREDKSDPEKSSEYKEYRDLVEKQDKLFTARKNLVSKMEEYKRSSQRKLDFIVNDEKDPMGFTGAERDDPQEFRSEREKELKKYQIKIDELKKNLETTYDTIVEKYKHSLKLFSILDKPASQRNPREELELRLTLKGPEALKEFNDLVVKTLNERFRIISGQTEMKLLRESKAPR